MNNSNNLVKYNYIIYGLHIKSEIPLQELIEADGLESGASDVTIVYGTVPREISGTVIDGKYIKLTKREFYLYITGAAHYYVAHGNRIIVELEEQSDMEEMKVFLLGSCLGILLTQRNIIAIHGGSIAIGGKGIIITGQTGAGKSTLTAAFRKEGYYFLADDVSALGKDQNSKLIIYPSYPQVKLCRDAMGRMGYDPNKFKKTDPYRDKFAIPLAKSYLKHPVILCGIYEICAADIRQVVMNEILGAEKISLILRNIYRIEISKALGVSPECFKKCLEIAKNIPVYRILRPKDDFTVEQQTRLIKRTLSKAVESAV